MDSVRKKVEALEAQGFVCRVEGEEVVCENKIELPSMKIGTQVRIPKRELEKVAV